MCTVTYIPAPGGSFMTSNRDEQRGRPLALEPEYYVGRTGRLLYPKDAGAGGTWFVLHEKGTVLVLLNGARERHIPQPPYRKSRGLVLLELADSDNCLEAFKTLNLIVIEPFTLILLEAGNLFECRWDGLDKVQGPVDAAIPHIWSSVTLYDPETIQKRREWFGKWLPDHPAPDQDDILRFHRFTGDGDPNNDLLMNREDRVLTVSITSLRVSDKDARMTYLDILTGKTADRQLSLTKGAAPALSTPAAL
ncbi:MAG TPA: NRDE family protein [Puia sp.]